MSDKRKYIQFFDDIDSGDVSSVGGKNASLGEMFGTLKEEGIRVPSGFATTAEMYWDYVETNELRPVLKCELRAYQSGANSLRECGEAIREAFRSGTFTEEMQRAIIEAYASLGDRYDRQNLDVAVRSSATAEDLPTASFAGQQESFLNVSGDKSLLEVCKRCFASLFTDRAITYRDEKGFDHFEVALSIGVQKMVRSDKASAGVIFTIDTESGFPDVIVNNAAWGLGESVVQGTVSPDEYLVFKPLLDREDCTPILEKKLGRQQTKIVYDESGQSRTKQIPTTKQEQIDLVLNDEEILTLARWAKRIEEHYDQAMDIEWAKDGEDGQLYVVQARPETVQSQKDVRSVDQYHLKDSGKRLLEGMAIGDAIAAGEAMVIEDSSDIEDFEPGTLLVTDMTQPDWVPIMKQAKGIITDEGGRTCHAAIVSRELGIPSIVGTETATEVLETGDEVTLSCAEGGTGYVYDGLLEYETVEINLDDIPKTDVDVMMNMASPEAAFRWWFLPVDGIGLARIEFIISNDIRIHPMALVNFDQLQDKDLRERINTLTAGYDDKREYFVDRLSRGIARLASSQYPKPVLVRMGDMKSNEYASLIGGGQIEKDEDNPMLGVRGASRYYSDRFREGFRLECKAVKRARETIGLENVNVMIPFCRTVEEADRVLELMREYGLDRKEEGLEVYVMAEIPSNIILAEEFADRFDGFSIGSNDLTQLTLGVDRDSEALSELFDERNPAVKRSVAALIDRAHEKNRPVGICGQAPSDYPEFAQFLLEEGIDSISLNPDSVVEVKKHLGSFNH
jgi:pyruvate,water dikinase